MKKSAVQRKRDSFLLGKKAVSSSGFSCSVCTLCRPLRCKALKSRLWQKDAPCQRLYLYSDLLLGCAFTVCRGNDRPAAIRSAQAHLFCAAVNEVRLCSPDELTVLEVLAALVHSQQLCNGHNFCFPSSTLTSGCTQCVMPQEWAASSSSSP